MQMRRIGKLILTAAIYVSVSILGQVDVNAEELLSLTDETLEEESLDYELVEETLPEVQLDEECEMLGTTIVEGAGWDWYEEYKMLIIKQNEVRCPDLIYHL